eukprot:GHVU01215755.1.p1 GENE.GHVU01215755.1~~GHVU01215755.1.p1  ORF type:complete len:162 (-),score=10.75 GHVU01215755.1:378-863(-)
MHRMEDVQVEQPDVFLPMKLGQKKPKLNRVGSPPTSTGDRHSGTPPPYDAASASPRSPRTGRATDSHRPRMPGWGHITVKVRPEADFTVPPGAKTINPMLSREYAANVREHAVSNWLAIEAIKRYTLPLWTRGEYVGDTHDRRCTYRPRSQLSSPCLLRLS